MTMTTGWGGSPRGPDGIGFAVPIDRARQVAATRIGRG